jgi:prepilin-type processing-associated H-X9-DG protein
MKNSFSLLILGTVLWGSWSAPVRGAILTSVPMQGSMVMPELSYYAADGALYVTMDPAIPQLTPLLASHPGDSFDPADPWFDALDPSRQGLAFSRRYGFVMGPATDQLPAGTGIWIRKLSGSAQLGFSHFWMTTQDATDVDTQRHKNRSNYNFVDGHSEARKFHSTYDPTRQVDLWNPSLAQ